MRIVEFTEDCIVDAKKLMEENYNEECEAVDLPKPGKFPKLEYYAKNGLGVAAYENDKMVGYLCCYEPWEGAFDTYDELGTFCPIHGHGAIKENGKRIYQDMFAEAGKLWASKNIMSFGIALYQHDIAAKEAFFEYGFGSRLTDQIRKTCKIVEERNPDFVYEELKLEDFPEVREMRKSLNGHLKNSPCFLQTTSEERDNWISEVEKGDRRTFVARLNGKIVSYLDVAEEGENFLTVNDKMANIQGAYTLQEYRGKGVTRDLLDYVLEVMRNEGMEYLGVDHETYNPTANRFWKKYFKAYTNSLVRHIELWSVGK